MKLNLLHSRAFSGANGWILGWMNPRWVSMDGTLIWINYNEQNPGQSPTDWNPFLTQLWMNLSWVDNRVDPSLHHSSIHPPLMLCHSCWVHSHCTPQYVKVSVVVRTTKGWAQRNKRKPCKFAFERLLHKREYNSAILKGCYMKESTIVIKKLCFFPFGKEPLWFAHLKKIIGTLDVPQDHEAFGVFKGRFYARKSPSSAQSGCIPRGRLWPMHFGVEGFVVIWFRVSIPQLMGTFLGFHIRV